MEGIFPAGTKRRLEMETSSDDESSSDESWSATPQSDDSEPVIRVIQTRSRGPAEKVDVADDAMAKADEVVNNESDFSSTTADEEEEDEDEEEEEDEETSEEDDEYSDDDSFVTSTEGEDEDPPVLVADTA